SNRARNPRRIRRVGARSVSEDWTFLAYAAGSEEFWKNECVKKSWNPLAFADDCGTNNNRARQLALIDEAERPQGFKADWATVLDSASLGLAFFSSPFLP